MSETFSLHRICIFWRISIDVIDSCHCEMKVCQAACQGIPCIELRKKVTFGDVK